MGPGVSSRPLRGKREPSPTTWLGEKKRKLMSTWTRCGEIPEAREMKIGTSKVAACFRGSQTGKTLKEMGELGVDLKKGSMVFHIEPHQDSPRWRRRSQARRNGSKSQMQKALNAHNVDLTHVDVGMLCTLCSLLSIDETTCLPLALQMEFGLDRCSILRGFAEINSPARDPASEFFCA